MVFLQLDDLLELAKQEQAERRRQVAQDALARSAVGDRAWSWPGRWLHGLVRLWSAVRPRPQVHPSDAVLPSLRDYPYPR